MNRIPLQPEWDLIQRKIGALNALQSEREYWCYQPWPETDEEYELGVSTLPAGDYTVIMTSPSMGRVLDHLDNVLENLK